MVKYALDCRTCGVGFEGWFSSSDAFDQQREAGELSCPNCGAGEIVKQIMAPSVRDSKSRTTPSADKMRQMAEMAKAVREHVSSTHEYVGGSFAETARAMHYGETDSRPVWGETTPAEAKELVEEGVPAMPLPAPFVPEKPVDQKKLN